METNRGIGRAYPSFMSQHRLQFALRGAEWAFAIPDGDLAALEEVAAICCDFWNGANSLVIAIGEDGSLNADTERERRVPDAESLEDDLRELRERREREAVPA